MNGGGKELKNIILSEHTGMGVVAALVTTIIVSLMMLSPSVYHDDNLYNEQASILLHVLLSLSLIASMSTITLSFEVYSQTLKVPEDKMEWWVRQLKGRLRTECVLHIYVSLYLLCASIVDLTYLLSGLRSFIIVCCNLIPGYVLVNLNTGTIHQRFLTHILYPEKHQGQHQENTLRSRSRVAPA